MSWRNQYRLWRYPELAKFEDDEDREQAWKTCRERISEKTKKRAGIGLAIYSLFVAIAWGFALWPTIFILSMMGMSVALVVAFLIVLTFILMAYTITLSILHLERVRRRYLRDLLAERGIILCTRCGYDLRSLSDQRCSACGQSIDHSLSEMRPPWKRMILTCGIPLAVPLSIIWGFQLVGQNRLDRSLEEARKLGPVTYDEIALARRSWKDEENGAMVIVNLGPQLDVIKKETEKSELPILGSGDLPNLGRHWPMEVDQLVEDALRRWSEELAQINRLIEYEGGRFPLTIAPNPVDTLFPHLVQVRTAVRLKSLDTFHRIVHGDTANLCDDIAIMFTLGRLLEDEPALVSALVRNAVDALTVSIIEWVCAQGILEPDLVLELEAMLAAADLDSRLYWGMLGERAIFVESFRWMRSDAYTNELDQGAKTGLRWGIYKGFLHDQATGLVFWNRYVQAVQDPSTGPQLSATIRAEVTALPEVFLITKELVHDFGRAFVLDMKTTSQIRAARTAMALERYRIAHGRWPDTLDKLVPEYLASIPLDPFDGRPLRYSLKDDAAVIYSISENLVDNSGEVASFHPSAPRDATDCGFTLLPPARRGLPADEADSGQVPAAGK